MPPAPSGPAATPCASMTAALLQRLQSRERRPGEASMFFHDRHFERVAAKVLPGEWFVHDEDMLIVTTLGSCIAACLWDRDRRIGGMNHFMLPQGPGGDAGADAGRYGAFAMDLLIGEMVKRGATRATMDAKVFGGGAVIGGMTTLNVGERNTQFVLVYLRTERIAVVSRDVLDIHPRKVCFWAASGRAMVRRLPATQGAVLTAHERATAPGLPAAGGSVDLF